jgi:hypothetical protein
LKRLTIGVLAVAFSGALACVAGAQQIETTPIPMLPKPDLSSMKFLVGTWNCSSKSARRPSPSTSTGTYALDPSGYWLVLTWTAPGVSWYPHASAGSDHISYDASTKRWIDTETDNNGGYDLSAASGWQGNTIVWHDITYPKGADLASNGDTTETKVSDTKVTTVSSFKTKKGRVVGVTTTCTKT